MVDCATASLSIVFGCEFLVVACHDWPNQTRENLRGTPRRLGASVLQELETMICQRPFVTFVASIFSVPFASNFSKWKMLEVTCQILRLFDVKFDVDAILKGFNMKEMMKKGMVTAIKEAGDGGRGGWSFEQFGVQGDQGAELKLGASFSIWSSHSPRDRLWSKPWG